MSELGNPVYRFRDFELEPSERRLSKAGKALTLTPKVFDTLVLLVERAEHVVSKEELMKTLWPRGYVDESNLTKHIWLIRRALGDGEEDPRFIDTVPKLGYRFVAPVTKVRRSPASTPDEGAATAPTPVSPPPRRESEPMLASNPSASALSTSRAMWYFAISALLLASALLWRMTLRPPAPQADGHGRTVALVGFANLSRNAKDAWLAPALSEMLGAELTVVGDLQVVPDELVRDASLDLTPPATGGYSPETLARLRRRLRADYVLSGSYLVTGKSDEAPLRVDLALQDARSGALVASISEHSTLTDLIEAATQAGAGLRDKLGVSPAGAEALGRVASAQPPTVDVARRLGFALDALQHYDAARARDELLQAIAEAPGYAPAYTLLARAWSNLGYRDRALAAAGQAAEHSANLPPEQRLQAQMVFASLRADGAAATQAGRALVQLKPLDSEYRLQLIDAQIAAGAAPQAQETLADLRRQPGAGDDPRTELAAARISSALDDARAAAAHAELALRQARQHDAAGLVADAQRTLAGAQLYLRRNEEARTGLLAAIEGYRAMRNPRGEASARRALGQTLSGLNRAQEAREEYQRALTLYQGIGDIGGVAIVYRDQCEMLWFAGDTDGARAAARNGLDLARETGDLFLQAWMLRALATIASDDAASDEVLSEYREVIALNDRSGNRGGHVWSLGAYADVERMRGNLDEASAYCGRAIPEAAALSDPQFGIYSAFTCALVRMDRGETEAARAALHEVARHLNDGGDRTYANSALTMLAQLDMDEARWSAARDQLQQATSGFAAAEEATGEAEAQSLLALCLHALHDVAARDAAAERARKLRQSISSRQEVFRVDIALAQLAGETLKDPAAAERLLAIAADAAQRRWVGWSLEAKLAAWSLMQAPGSNAHGSNAARALRRDIETTARLHGFGRVTTILRRWDLDAARLRNASAVRK